MKALFILFLGLTLFINQPARSVVVGMASTPVIIAAAVIVFAAGEAVVLSTAKSTYDYAAGSAIAAFFGYLAMSNNTTTLTVRALTPELAQSIGVSLPEMRAYNREIPTIEALLQSSPIDKNESVAYLSENRNLLSAQAQSAFGKVLAYIK